MRRLAQASRPRLQVAASVRNLIEPRHVGEGDLAAAVAPVGGFEAGELHARPLAAVVVFEDEDAQFASFTDAFGSSAAEAASEAIRRPVDARVETGSEHSHRPAAARYRLTRGRIERLSP